MQWQYMHEIIEPWKHTAISSKLPPPLLDLPSHPIPLFPSFPSISEFFSRLSPHTCHWSHLLNLSRIFQKAPLCQPVKANKMVRQADKILKKSCVTLLLSYNSIDMITLHYVIRLISWTYDLQITVHVKLSLNSVWIKKPTRCHFLYSLFLF